MSAKDRILNLLKAAIGKIVPRQAIIDAAESSEWARRIRDLRAEGWSIETVQDGYILKSMSQAEILLHVRQTLEGFTPISPQVATYLIELLKPPPSAALAPESAHVLTAREAEILSIFGRGLTYVETARVLGISANTVRDFVKKIYAKLDVHSRSEAVFEAKSLGLIETAADKKKS